ncbi:MAG: hypothetical protein JWO69_333 [Thermoleophilia bacterium]|jgi:hypothetical protein|nr:hypothetical protein [Thermoleophilia bacterium]
MAAKKARKRAYIPPTQEVVNRREKTTTSRPAPRSAQRPGGPRQPMPYPEPTLKRTLKRLPIYFLMIFALQYFLQGKADVSTNERLFAAAVVAVMVTVAFAPFMHMMDRFAYNRYVKRSKGDAAK